jgi:hypothetical protein
VNAAGAGVSRSVFRIREGVVKGPPIRALYQRVFHRFALLLQFGDNLVAIV